MIKKIVIPSAGIGSRLLPATKEIPKEMMPLFMMDKSGKVSVKPLIQIVYEQFYSLGIREFCIIVGKQKRAIEDHFSPDYNFLNDLAVKSNERRDLKEFYTKLETSRIFWINQHGPRGFGDAVLTAESFVGQNDFLVSAGDTLLPKTSAEIKKLIKTKLRGKNDAVLILKKVSDPKRFGVAVVKKTKQGYVIKNVEEKPNKPRSDYAIVALYHFRPSIFKALKEIKFRKELQLTDGIQKLIEWDGSVKALILDEKDIVIDIGTPASYLDIISDMKG